MFVFDAKMGKKLTQIRKRAELSQKQVAERMGIKSTSGQAFIARLENGFVKNPSMKTILDYLSICGQGWGSYFKDISAIQFNKEHQDIISKIDIPQHYKKVTRDVAKYQYGIETKFANKQNLNPTFPRKGWVKPLTQQQKEKMSVKFGKHRTVIEQIERDITLLLGDLGEPYGYNQFYKAFARECYSVIRKITAKTQKVENTKEISAVSASSAVNSKLNQIVEKWNIKGLKREILEKVKEIPIRFFQETIFHKTD
jgi:transcriptional regulator with XRE-family HTH domain